MNVPKAGHTVARLSLPRFREVSRMIRISESRARACSFLGTCRGGDADVVGFTRPARRGAVADQSGRGADGKTCLRWACDQSLRRPWRWRRRFPWRRRRLPRRRHGLPRRRHGLSWRWHGLPWRRHGLPWRRHGFTAVHFTAVRVFHGGGFYGDASCRRLSASRTSTTGHFFHRRFFTAAITPTTMMITPTIIRTGAATSCGPITARAGSATSATGIIIATGITAITGVFTAIITGGHHW